MIEAESSHTENPGTKPLLFPLSGLAGLVSGVCGGWVTYTLDPEISIRFGSTGYGTANLSDVLLATGAIGAGLGLGVAAASLPGLRWGWRALLGAVTGFMGMLGMMLVVWGVRTGFFPEGGDLEALIKTAVFLGPLVGATMTAINEFHRRRGGIWIPLGLSVSAAAFTGAPLWLAAITTNYWILLGWMNGAMFGLVQFVGFETYLRIARRGQTPLPAVPVGGGALRGTTLLYFASALVFLTGLYHYNTTRPHTRAPTEDDREILVTMTDFGDETDGGTVAEVREDDHEVLTYASRDSSSVPTTLTCTLSSFVKDDRAKFRFALEKQTFSMLKGLVEVTTEEEPGFAWGDEAWMTYLIEQGQPRGFMFVGRAGRNVASVVYGSGGAPLDRAKIRKILGSKLEKIRSFRH